MRYNDPSLHGRSGIYRIYPTDGEEGHEYIGQSSDFYIRWRDHHKLLLAGDNTPIFQHAWDKHGEAVFEWEILEEVPPVKALLTEREQYYLDTRRPLYNIAKVAGTTLGVRYDERVREIYRQGAHKRHQRYRQGELPLTQRQREQIDLARAASNAAKRGVPWSDELRRIMMDRYHNQPPSEKELARRERLRGHFDQWKHEKAMQVMAENSAKRDTVLYAKIQEHQWSFCLPLGRYQAAKQLGSECGWTTRMAWLTLGRLAKQGLVTFTSPKGRKQEARTEAQLAYWDRKRGTTQTEEHKAKVNAKRAERNAQIATQSRAAILAAMEILGWGTIIIGRVTPAARTIGPIAHLCTETVARYLGQLIGEGIVTLQDAQPRSADIAPFIRPTSLTQGTLFEEA
jgi:group I intron endonuclease